MIPSASTSAPSLKPGLCRTTRLAMAVPVLTFALALAAEGSPDPETRAMFIFAAGVAVPALSALILAFASIGEMPSARERLLRASLILVPFVACGLYFGGLTSRTFVYGGLIVTLVLAVTGLVRMLARSTVPFYRP